jgi:asparagine synthase (glutamine-hydrolysing)
MSAILGMVRFDGRPVSGDDLERMAAPMAHWGSEPGFWHGERAGLGLLADLRTPRAAIAPAILADDSVVVAIGRLDNAEDLARELSLEAETPDGAIMAAAWERWRGDSPRHLHGDWSFAAWSPRTRELFLARDPFGNTALSYHLSGGFFAFASSARALFAAGVPRRLNEFRLAQHLAAWTTDGEATLHEGVVRLAPGSHLTVRDARVDVRRYWFPEDLPDVRLSSPDAYVERFVELYDDAVRARLRTSGGAAVTLSSGLDSGSVAALAARQLRATGQELAAFTSVPLHPGVAAFTRMTVDEWDLAHATATWAGNIEHHRITAADVTPLAAIERSLRFHDEPELASGNLYWMTAMFDAARDRGATVLLTGQLGNGGISWGGDQQRVLNGFARFRWFDAWAGLRQAQRQFDGSMLRALLTQVVLPRRAKRSTAQFLKGRIDPPFMRMIAPAFAARTRVVERMRETGYDAFFGARLDPRGQRLRYLLPEISPFGAFWAETSAGFGIDVRDPTADVRLLEFCLSIPDAVYRDAAHDRLLVRRAMEGLLPPSVQWNRRRGRQAADLPFRLRDDAASVSDAVRAVVASPIARETLNVGALLDVWARLRARITPASIGDAFTVARFLHLGRFLMALEQERD